MKTTNNTNTTRAARIAATYTNAAHFIAIGNEPAARRLYDQITRAMLHHYMKEHKPAARLDIMTARAMKDLNPARRAHKLDVIRPYAMKENSRRAAKQPNKKSPVSAYRPLVSHRAPVVGRVNFKDPAYHEAVIVAAGKVKAARRRGVSDPNNIYLNRWADNVQTAAAAVYGYAHEEETFWSLIPTGYDIDTTALEAFEPYANVTLFRYAARACGKWAYDEERRAAEFISGEELKTLIDKCQNPGKVEEVKESRLIDPRRINISTPSDRTAERAERDFIKQWTERAADLINHLKISQAHRNNLLSTLEGKADKTPRPNDYRRHLDGILKKAGMIKLDARGHRVLVDTIGTREGQRAIIEF